MLHYVLSKWYGIDKIRLTSHNLIVLFCRTRKQKYKLSQKNIDLRIPANCRRFSPLFCRSNFVQLNISCDKTLIFYIHCKQSVDKVRLETEAANRRKISQCVLCRRSGTLNIEHWLPCNNSHFTLRALYSHN